MKNLVTEGRANEIAAMIQRYRKTLDTTVSDKIELSIDCNEIYVTAACFFWRDEIMHRCGIAKFHQPHSLIPPPMLRSPIWDRVTFITRKGQETFECLLTSCLPGAMEVEWN